MNSYEAVRQEAQARANAHDLYFRGSCDIFGAWYSIMVPKPAKQFGRDLEGELVSPECLTSTDGPSS